ncbi:GNAT family N-acetyltransferase [Ulvibacterium sp.]|uniref:GNAT family N-acetyltransferase n=1 Tax=Ulvibacterium sp. TaxID=2665914 RepID=UPI00261F91D0|nr:GNAT family N-acetyltransferase [Ulvibacterium sp.]
MNFNLQPLLENDLVSLRPLREEDFENLLNAASDPLIWEQHQNKLRYTLKEFTLFFKESMISGGALLITDQQSKNVIGSSRFKIVDEVEEVVEIGWSFLARDYWGGFHNRAVKRLMVGYALNFCRTVVFYVHPKNFRSQKALEKIGAKRLNEGERSWVLPEKEGITYAISSPIE